MNRAVGEAPRIPYRVITEAQFDREGRIVRVFRRGPVGHALPSSAVGVLLAGVPVGGFVERRGMWFERSEG